MHLGPAAVVLNAALLFVIKSTAVPAQAALISRPAFAAGSGPLILYDTAHWNPTIREGRYLEVAELLRADGYRVQAGRLPFDIPRLASHDLLLVVTPYLASPATDPAGASRPVFSDAECDVIEQWVRRGGNLLLVVGHQPSGIAHANLARRFGVELRNGVTYDSTPANNWTDGNSACLGCLKFTSENGLVRRHPITNGRDSSEIVRSVISAAGQSLGVPDDNAILLALGPAAYDVLAIGGTVPAAGRAQAVALKIGNGRVVVIGDGSILSGFRYGPENPRFRRWWPRDPDNKQFTLNVVRWLSGVLATSR